MLVREIIAKYESYCPQSLSLEGDISGLQIGRFDKEVKRLMVSLDVRETTVKEAISKNVDMIIVKHAPIFKPLNNLLETPQTAFLLDLVKHDITVYVSHTNIDVVPDGLNDWFCELLSIKDTSVLHETKDSYGIGRIGTITPQSFEEFAEKVKATFALDTVRLISYDRKNPMVEKVAICGGSGQSFYADALAKGADVFVTGDIYYHTAQDMLTNGLLAIDPGHHIEVLFISKLAQKFENWKNEEGWELTVLESQSSTNPFYHL